MQNTIFGKCAYCTCIFSWLKVKISNWWVPSLTFDDWFLKSENATLYTTGCILQLCVGEAQQGEGTISKNCVFITITFWRTLLTVMIMVSRNLDSHRFNKNYHRLLVLGGWTGETQLFIVLSGNGNSRYNRWIQITTQKAENCGLQPQ